MVSDFRSLKGPIMNQKMRDGLSRLRMGKHTMRTIHWSFVLAAAVVGVFNQPLSGAIIILDPVDSSIANGVEDLMVGGMLFDVDFTQALMTFDTIFGAGDPPPLLPTFYNDPVGAAAAADAIEALFTSNQIRVGTAANPSTLVDVPFRDPSSPLSMFLSEVTVTTAAGGIGARRQDTVSRTQFDVAIALFTKVTPGTGPVVPEPASVLVWLGLACAVGVGTHLQRRQRLSRE